MFASKMKLFSVHLFHLIILIHVCIIKSEITNSDAQNARKPPRIAIIGAGIGGTSAAYFLRQMTGGHALIDVYESGHVGGRIATASLAGKNYEAGAVIAILDSKYTNQFVQELGLSKDAGGCGGGTAGLFNGKEFVFRLHNWIGKTVAKVMLRYGWDAFTLLSYTDDFFKKFSSIHSKQQNGDAYRTVHGLLHAMHPSFPALTKFSTRQYFREKIGLSERIVSEVVTAATLGYYGHTPDNMHAFAGSFCTVGLIPGMWRVSGGNRQIPEQLLIRSSAKLLRRHATQVAVIGKNVHGRDVYQVSSVEADNSFGGIHDLYTEGGYPLYRSCQPQEQQKYKDAIGERAEDVLIREYDAVIVATPLTTDKSDLKFVNTSTKFSFLGKYLRYITTLVEGKLRNAAFNLPDRDTFQAIFAVNPLLVYNLIGKNLLDKSNPRCDEARPTGYMVYSPQPLTSTQLQLLFEDVNSTRVIDWRAFPEHDPRMHSDASFELQPGLYHANAAEWLGSNIEMSAVTAKNVALLAFKYLTGDATLTASL